MSKNLLRAAAVAAAVTLLGTAARAATGAPDDPRDLIAHAKIPLRDAISTAIDARPGDAVAVGLELDEMDGKAVVVWEVVVAGAHGAFHEVVVDAASGRVLEDEAADEEDVEGELAETRTVLRHAELTLSQLVEKAEAIVHGRSAGAAFELGDDGPECEVLIANGRYLFELDLEARAGHLVDLEFESDFRGGEEREHGEEGEEHQQGEEGEEHEHGEEGEEHEHGEEEGERRGREDPEEGEDDGGAGESSRGGTREHAYVAPTPLADGVTFSSKIVHPYFPLSAVRLTELRSGSEKVIREVQDETRKVAGVECLVLAEKEFEDGELAEISYNFFAQDGDGSVWYFGEDVDDYEDGEVVGHGGAWLVGRNAKEPCLFMPARLELGFRFKRENSPPDAEEFDQIAAWIEEMRTPGGTFEHVLTVRESDHGFGPWTERKYYARGVGLISENGELNLARMPGR